MIFSILFQNMIDHNNKNINYDINQLEKLNQLIQNFNLLVDQIDKTHFKQSIIETNRFLNIKIYNLQRLSISKVKELYKILANKFYNEEKSKSTWHQNQLRIFVWTMIGYKNIIQKSFDSFEFNDWKQLSSFFMKKSPQICKFQYFTLKRYIDRYDKWSQQEDLLLLNILRKKQTTNKWNQVAKQLFNHSNHFYFRTAKQCRERWNNYLDPTKIKGKWSKQQDLKLIKFVMHKGKKWSTIAKQLQNTRTQHMVKNRYKSLLAQQNKGHKKKYYIQSLVLEDIQKRLLNEIQNNQKKTEVQKIKQQQQQYQQDQQQQHQQVNNKGEQDCSLDQKKIVEAFIKIQMNDQNGNHQVIQHDKKQNYSSNQNIIQNQIQIISQNKNNLPSLKNCQIPQRLQNQQNKSYGTIPITPEIIYYPIMQMYYQNYGYQYYLHALKQQITSNSKIQDNPNMSYMNYFLDSNQKPI